MRVNIDECEPVSATPDDASDADRPAYEIAHRQGWLRHGAALVDGTGHIIATTFDEASEAMRALSWITEEDTVDWGNVDNVGSLASTSTSVAEQAQLSASKLRTFVYLMAVMSSTAREGEGDEFLGALTATNPQCPNDGTTMRDMAGGWRCGGCGATIKAPPVTYPRGAGDGPALPGY